MGIGFAFLMIYCLCIAWFENKFKDRHVEYMMLKLVLFYGGIAALLLGIYFFLLTPETKSIVLLRLDVTSLVVSCLGVAAVCVYRFGWKRWRIFRRHTNNTYAHVVGIMLWLTIAMCVVLTLTIR